MTTLAETYNPDVLTCLANLSNDEVFTPPAIANDMLDQLPEELWSDPNAKFLDPASKSGVFLREIAKRLMIGLSSRMPDTQERINHIYTNQLYGIGITELTGLLTRRSLYCSKYANGKYSIVESFDNENGNIDFSRTEHKWFNEKCVFCGANQSEYERSEDLETHAYKFIHTNKPEELYDMKFDVIIGNPPYQLSTGGSGVQATPLYNKFVEQAKKLNPRYLTMIVPARWYSGGFGLDSFRDGMLKDSRVRRIVDYPEATDAFTGVQIKGGVMYFLWDRDNQGDVTVSTFRKDKIVSTATRPLLEHGSETFVRYNEAANYADEFLQKVITENAGNVYWLTTHQWLGENRAVERLSPFLKEETVQLLKDVKPTSWKEWKTEGIDFTRPFLWFDDDLYPTEEEALKAHDVLENHIKIDLYKDPDQLAKLVASFPIPKINVQ